MAHNIGDSTAFRLGEIPVDEGLNLKTMYTFGEEVHDVTFFPN
jgi:hypothetical protein